MSLEVCRGIWQDVVCCVALWVAVSGAPVLMLFLNALKPVLLDPFGLASLPVTSLLGNCFAASPTESPIFAASTYTQG